MLSFQLFYNGPVVQLPSEITTSDCKKVSENHYKIKPTTLNNKFCELSNYQIIVQSYSYRKQRTLTHIETHTMSFVLEKNNFIQ